ncbi:MAG: potassium channel protein [Planctomycetia bacterium]|nr:potassium channel protein [Planctomycetia bacterium]
MKPPLLHLRIGLMLLATIIIVGVAVYRMAGWSLIESIYMVAMIVSTVGMEEVCDLSSSPGLQLFTTGLIVVGVSTALYIIGAFVQMMTQGEINRALGLQRVSREIRRLGDHVILCGFGRMGEILAGQLRQRNRSLVVVENDPERIAEAMEHGYLTVNDNATEEDALESAGVRRAATLVTTLPHDADNVFITLTARNLNPKLHIIARAESQPTEKKLVQAGANRVVMPAATGALRMAAMITRPSMVELIELVAGRETAEVEVDELILPPECELVGRTVGESHIRSRNGLLIVAVRRGNNQLLFAPGADMRFEAGDRVLVIGRLADIERFRREYGI